MGKALQPVSVDGIEFDALITSSEVYESTVPEYTVETGFIISDSIILKPVTLDMTLFVSNMPVTWKTRFGDASDRVDEVVSRLKELYMSREPVTVTTSSDTYTSMAITSITISKSNSIGYAKEIPIKFKQIRTTESKTTTIPDSYGRSGATAAASGTAGTTTSTSSNNTKSSSKSSSSDSSSSGKSGSTLYNAANALGLIK